MRAARRRMLACAVSAGLALPMMGGMAGATATSSPAIALSIFDSTGPARLASTHKGKPFVLVVWSLDCVYCKHNFEAIGQLQARYPGLRVVTLSMDTAAARPQVTQLLARYHLTQDAWLFGNDPPQRLQYAIDPDWMGEMPRTYFYRADGERRGVSGVIKPAGWAEHLRWAGIAS